MHYKAFTIKNFKGVKETSINLEGIAGASMFALVGLNESGKTTVLEAIYSFSPDGATSELAGNDDADVVSDEDRVPRHLISTFTGVSSVTAHISVTDEDKQQIAASCSRLYEIELNLSSIGSEVTLNKIYRYERGNFKGYEFNLDNEIEIRVRTH